MKTLRILVVEDDNMIGVLLAEMLEEMGHEVCGIAATEADAVSAAASCKPDLMIVDVVLGEGSGVAAVVEILRAGPVAHLFVTGDTTTVQALMPGAVVLRKPYRESDLVRATQQAWGAVSNAG